MEQFNQVINPLFTFGQIQPSSSQAVTTNTSSEAPPDLFIEEQAPLNDQQTFWQQEFTKLNPAQQEAVLKTKGPVFMRAVPGAGKTQTTAMRIAYLVLFQNVDPEKILSLTFTTNGTEALRSRVAKFVGHDIAERVKIATFHAFAHEIKDTHNDEIPLFENCQTLVEDADKFRILDEILDELKEEYQAEEAKAKTGYEQDPSQKLLKRRRRYRERVKFLESHTRDQVKSSFLHTLASEIRSLKLENISPSEYIESLKRNANFLYRVPKNPAVTDFILAKTQEQDDHSITSLLSFLRKTDPKAAQIAEGEYQLDRKPDPNYIEPDFISLIQALARKAKNLSLRDGPRQDSSGQAYYKKSVSEFKKRLKDFCYLQSKTSARLDEQKKNRKKRSTSEAQLSIKSGRQNTINGWFVLYDVFKKYNERLKELHLFDQEDIIPVVVKALRKTSLGRGLRAHYADQYEYFTVDEFQDTNGAQMAELQTIAGDLSQANVFAVGDPDQAIFSFQDANIENLNGLIEHPKTHVVTSNENYRSNQNILDVSQTLIEHNLTRVGAETNQDGRFLVARNTNVATKPVEVHQYAHYDDEILGMADKINQLKAEGMDYKDITILCRRNKDIDRLSNKLNLLKIPNQIKRNYNLLDDNNIRSIIDLLKVIQNPRSEENDLALWSLLNSTYFQNSQAFKEASITIDDLDRVDEMRRVKHYKTYDAIKSIDKFTPILTFLDKYRGIARNSQKDFTTSFFEPLMIESGFINESLVQEIRLAEQIELDETELDALEKYNCFKRFVGKSAELFESEKSTKLGRLNRVIENLDTLEENGVPLEYTQSQDKDSVTISTVHGYKGLESRAVLIHNFVQGNWGSNAQGNSIKHPYSLLKGEERALEKDDDEEERRLAYVACTRAQELLCIYSNNKSIENSPRKESKFLREILSNEDLIENGSLSVDDHRIEESSQAKTRRLMLDASDKAWDQAKIQANKAKVSHLLERRNFAVSATSLNEFLACSMKFYFNNLRRAPAPVFKEKVEFIGEAVHAALRVLNRSIQAQQQERASEDSRKSSRNTIEFPKREMDNTLAEVFTRHGIDKDSPEYKKATKLLRDYFQNHLKADLQNNTVLGAEQRLAFNLDYEDGFTVPVTGTIDKIELERDSEGAEKLKIIDYKSYGEDSSTGALSRGGEIFNQMLFYNLLLREAHKRGDIDYDPLEAETRVEFLERGSHGFVTKTYKFEKNLGYKEKTRANATDQYVFTEQDLDDLKVQIREAYERIMDAQYRRTDDKGVCDGCSYPTACWTEGIGNPPLVQISSEPA